MDCTTPDSCLPLPTSMATDKEWKAFAIQQCSALLPHLQAFIIDRFDYKLRYVKPRLNTIFGTATARTKRYDIHLRMFCKPCDFWPRERLVLARIIFQEERVGHGSALLLRLVQLAPLLGYRYIGIESANPNSSAFAQRLGFTPCQHGRNWLADVDMLKKRLAPDAIARGDQTA